MSIPWWNEKKPGPSKPPASTPFSNTVRGSPKNPRIGCCLVNGLNGQLYADAAPAEASASAATAIAIPVVRTGPDAWYAGLRPFEGGPEVLHEPLHLGIPHASRQREC